MKQALDSLRKLSQYQSILRGLSEKKNIVVHGMADIHKVHMTAALVRHTGSKVLYITYNELQAKQFLRDLRQFVGDEAVILPGKEITLYDVAAESHENIYNRVSALYRILSGKYRIIVASVEALSHYLMPAKDFMGTVLTIKNSQWIEMDEMIEKLSVMGYERSDTVEGKGQFSVRGGIVDIFPIHLSNPCRIEFFDMEVDSIRLFDPESQRSVDSVEIIDIVPAREIVYCPEDKGKINKRIKTDFNGFISGVKDQKIISGLRSSIESVFERIENMGYFPGIDKWTPYILENPVSISDYLIGDHLICVDERTRMKSRMDTYINEFLEQCKIMLEKGQLLPKTCLMQMNYDQIMDALDFRQGIHFQGILSREKMNEIALRVDGKTIDPFGNRVEGLINEIKRLRKDGYTVFLLAPADEKIQRMKNILTDNNIPYVIERNMEGYEGKRPVVILKGSLSTGFEYNDIRLAVIVGNEADTVKRSAKKRFTAKNTRKISIFTDLKTGDFVVHQAHGIGIYDGIEKLSVEGVKKDYLKINYKDGGCLYIPTTQMDLIQKYIGSEGRRPRINKLGGTEWSRAKNKVKESLKELAGELIKLQAERNSRKGYAFSPDTVWQKQFEEQFPYQETADQLKCIEEIKQDMESELIMDRLLCGDVGYGKTEVALRAVFKAVMDGKQVAFLVPTTVLASQHYETFKKRMESFPAAVEMLSRFRTPQEQKNILRKLKAGNIDILIGTHKLFNKEVKFKELGLLVIDEEQRFGVEQKERIKSAYPKVDILTLTATPIPRTLHMSLAGIRDISTIEDPPEDRIPVQTYVMEYNPDIIRDAIIREVARGGQAFYLYNRVRGIQVKRDQLQSLLPEANIGYAHGQMTERELENIMVSFLEKEYDVLVCTTIIESGLDMPNVNTIVVEDADHMGLSQLYQLRGRVGRSSRLAYAYLTFRRDKVLNEVAEKRLKAIREFTEFGSGFKIAMRDLQIRGAGNLLGPEQHGHMDSVGYEMYCRLLEDAVKELKGEQDLQLRNEVTVDINMDAFLDASYISDEKQRIDMYKAIAAVETEQDVMDVKDELLDRYGDIPKAAINLINIAYIKNLAVKCGFSQIKHKQDAMLLFFQPERVLSLHILSKLMEIFKGKLLFSAGKTPYLSYGICRETLDIAADNIKIVLQAILKLQT